MAHHSKLTTHYSKPRVLFLDQTGQLGGAELSLLDVAERFAGRGEELPGAGVVLFEDGPFRERLSERGVAVAVMPLSGAAGRASKRGGGWAGLTAAPGTLRQAWRVRRRAGAFDVMYANTQKAFVIAALALSRRPLVWHLRDMLDGEHFSEGNRRLAVNLANRRAAAVICNSQATAHAFAAAGGRQALCEVIPNGIGPAPFDEVDAATVQQTRRQLGLGGGPLIGVFGRLTEWKGQHVAIEALGLLQHEPAAHLILVGEAVFGEADRAYAARLREQVCAASLQDRVHFLGFRGDVPALMRACDGVVHSATSAEPFGRVVVEAMLSGTPVIASNAGGPAEIVSDGQTGRLVRPGDAGALAAVIDELLSDRAEAEAMASRAREHALREYALGPVLDRIEAVIERVMGGAVGGVSSS